MGPRKILVVGATGKQGSAFIRAAASNETESDGFRLIALTRDPKSPAARRLAAAGANVGLAVADLDGPASVRRVFDDARAVPGGGIWGVFFALAFPGLGADASGEEAHGKLIIDLASEYGVQHLIYSSSARGHESRDETATLSHLAKVNIEKHIQAKQNLRWTILQPVFFMENFEGTIGRITFSVVRVGVKADTKIQLTTVDDIGNIAFAVMSSPEVYAGQVIVIVSDILTIKGIEDAYARGTGRAMPAIPDLLARGVTAMNKGTRTVAQILENMNADRITYDQDWEARVARCREIYPGMHTFEAWAKEHDPTAEQAAGWNGVSFSRLIRGNL